ncbi:hypothetical protein [Methylomonas sp. MgM2]
MDKRYFWLVHDHSIYNVEISEEQIAENQLPVLYKELNKRYNLFVIYKKDIDDFLQKIKNILPCGCKAYEFSDDEILIGEHYIDPLTDVNVFIPWIGDQTQIPPKEKEYDYFFFADFNATFKVTDRILYNYLHKSRCRFHVLDCVNAEPAFYTDDKYYASKLIVKMHYADVLLVLGLLFKMLVENHKKEDEGSMTLLYGQFDDGRVKVFDRWCIANIWALSQDASFGHEMPPFCQWEFDQAIRKSNDRRQKICFV